MLKDAPCWNSTVLSRERILWTDEALKLKLLRKGILTRIYAPMVIVHGLRESGVFSSVIASAQKFSPSVTSMTAGVISSRKIVMVENPRQLQEGSCKFLTMLLFFSKFHQSPPGMEDINIEM